MFILGTNKTSYCDNCKQYSLRCGSTVQYVIFVALFIFGLGIGGIIYLLTYSGKRCYACGVMYGQKFNQPPTKQQPQQQ